MSDQPNPYDASRNVPPGQYPGQQQIQCGRTPDVYPYNVPTYLGQPVQPNMQQPNPYGASRNVPPGQYPGQQQIQCGRMPDVYPHNVPTLIGQPPFQPYMQQVPTMPPYQPGKSMESFFPLFLTQ
jgi:hypothetical protein